MTASPSFKLSVPSQEDTVATYARLASEYDEHGHTTTRALERLSNEAFRLAAPLRRSHATRPALLELGAGTGALTREILDAGGRRCLLATDPVAAMCAQLQTLLGEFESAEAKMCDATGALRVYGGEADVVLGGLADPFLTPGTLETARERMAAASLLFVTVPSHSWAVEEREGRLGIPADRTRFRLRDGTQLEAASWCYDEPELAELVLDAGFDVLDIGTRSAEHRVHQAPPEVAWALARLS